MTRKLIEHIPILGALIIILGIIKLLIFYNCFDLPIKYFVGLTEITIIIAEDILLFILIYFILLSVEILIKDNIKKEFTLFSSKDKANLILSIFVLVVNVGLLIWNLQEKEYYRQIVNSAYTYIFLFITIRQTKFIKEYLEMNKEFSFFLLFLALTLLHVTITTSKELKLVINGKYDGTKIVTNDTTYISSKSCYYIGQTDKYLFMYQPPKRCIILPTSTIKQIDFYIDK